MTRIGTGLCLLLAAWFALVAIPGAAQSVEAQGGAAAAPPPAVAADYVIGPGDTLQVFVWRNPELSVSVPVRPDGKISTPLVENMVAIGKSPSQLARDIERVLSEFVRSPQVNVIVGNAVSTFSQVKVVGQVRSPQALPYREGLRVLDVVLATGGLTDFAAPQRARIVRVVNGKNTEIKVKLGNLMNKGDLSQNHELKPGDVFLVPQSAF
jgi:polysaccharide export outer membrane protein